MKLAETISLSAGGSGSGCNPSKGKCGRPASSEEESPVVLNKSGWFKNGKFYALKNNYEMHDTAAIRNGLAGPHPAPGKLTNDYTAVTREAFQNGAVRVSNAANMTELEGWSKDSEDMREALLRIPDDTKDVLIEWWTPKHDAKEYPNKEAAVQHMYAAKKRKQ